MKTAEQWQEELCGETSVESIRRIQTDALAQALFLIDRLRTMRNTQDIRMAITEEIEKLTK